ncbi:MAG: hypothetical protein K2Y29_05020 [Beijerinckiaceae bacterium]|nr:hypothetical protein [Beijerinckiaceae bacterium]
MDQSSDKSGPEAASWAERVRQYGLVLVFAGPLYLAAGAAGETIGAAMTGQQGMHNLLPAALAIYILHRCFWD